MESKNYIICPHCEHVHKEWWEYIDFEKDNQLFDMNCEACDKLFEVDLVTTRIFKTSK